MAEITLDAVRSELEKNPDLKKSVIGILKDDFIKGAEAEGLVIRTKEQDQQYLTSQINLTLPEKVKQGVDQKFREMLDPIDAEILSLTGIPKQSKDGAPGEKTTDYAKRAFAEFHKKGGGDPVTKERVSQLEKMLSDKENQFKSELEKLNKQLFETEVGSQLDADLERRNVYIPPHITKEEDKQRYAQDQRKLAKMGILGSFTHKRDEQGNIIWHDSEGKPQLDSKDGKPKKITSLLDERYGTWFVPATHTATGTGTGQGGAGGATSGQFKSKEDIHKHLSSKGLDALSKEYRTELETLAKESNIAI